MRVRIHPSSLLLLLVLPSCDSLDEPPPLTDRMAPSVAPKCKGSGCGDNGIEMMVHLNDKATPLAFHELNADGVPNDQGVSLREFLSPPDDDGVSASLRLRVQRDVLTGEDKWDTIGGEELVGARMILDHHDDKGITRSYLLEILGVDVTTLSYWNEPGTVVPAYHIGWRDLDDPEGTKFTPLCDSLAVIFQGDRYDLDRLTVREEAWSEPGATWFNISCVGNVLAKLHLFRHTAASSDASHSTLVNERTAMLKMLNGDYCGNGYRFTTNGIPLHYVTRHEEFNLAPVPDMPVGPELQSIDAVWSERGAECIDVPRLVYEGYDTLTLFREMVITVDPDGACWPSIDDIPRCSQASTAWEGYGYLLSANPHR